MLCWLALPDLSTSNPGFVGRLIHGQAHAASATLLSFEKASAKLPKTHVPGA